MVATAKTMTEADLRPAMEALLDEIANGDDSHWQQYADRMAAEVAAGFKIGLYKVWSSNNRFYLTSQAKARKLAVHGMYAGVAQWQQRGREVREGEQPFIIFGPPTFRLRGAQPAPAGAPPASATPAPPVQPAATPAATNTTPAPAPQFIGYRRPPTIEVYDYSQTYSTQEDFDEPDWAVPLAGGDLGTLYQLTQVSPVPVTFTDIGAHLEHGWLDATGITIDSSRGVAEQTSTLAHELAHYHLGHLDKIASTRGNPVAEDTARAQCEQEAALTEFFVMKMLGLDESVGVNVTAAAGQYLRTWTKTNPDGTTTPIAGHKGRRKLLKARFADSFRAAQTIAAAYAQYDPTAPTTA